MTDDPTVKERIGRILDLGHEIGLMWMMPNRMDDPERRRRRVELRMALEGELAEEREGLRVALRAARQERVKA